eukprot:766112-Hanusia_phi.AAC.4
MDILTFVHSARDVLTYKELFGTTASIEFQTGLLRFALMVTQTNIGGDINACVLGATLSLSSSSSWHFMPRAVCTSGKAAGPLRHLGLQAPRAPDVLVHLLLAELAPAPCWTRMMKHSNSFKPKI